MKTRIIASILTLILGATLCSCGNTTPDETSSKDTDISLGDTSVSDTTNALEEKEIDFYLFPEVEPSSENLSVYRDEVCKRLSTLEDGGELFLRGYEWEVIERYLPEAGIGTSYAYNQDKFVTKYNELFDSVSKYYHPVVYRDGGLLYLWFTTENGTILFEKIAGQGIPGGNYGGNAHCDYKPGSVSLMSDQNHELTYNQETGKVSKWEFGQVIETYSVPEGSIYCGVSFFEGIIFRNGTDVYALHTANTYGEQGECVCIAHDVQYVIDANYQYGSDPWCQPLFLMTDGSLKAYIGWMGDENTAPDSPSHLCDLIYEGSWEKFEN